MDKELFRKLHEEGLISAEPTEMWLPMQTKDHKWQNYYSGKDGTTMHLSGGWMINVDTYELTQLEGYAKDSNKNELNGFQFPVDLLDTPSSVENPRFFTLKEALSSNDYKNANGSLLFPVGRDDKGKFVIADLHKLPHIMAGGQTGSGKSNFTEGTLILSLLYRYSADDLKLILIDPKMVQFTQYNGISHLLRPVITTPEDSKDAMDWLLKEMGDRFDILVDSKTKNIDEYNSSGKGHMPFVVLIIDEVADLMMVDGEYYQKSFIKLLQKSAVVGIHIYIGTSRPSEDVLPSLLRANFVTKIAFKTASKVDSEALIDVGGAENLLGRGDLLFSSLITVHPVHLQAPYVSDEETARVAEQLKNT
jgi:S-DNA-T family DNA segregation ATPase FtsK/SpoIIIE